MYKVVVFSIVYLVEKHISSMFFSQNLLEMQFRVIFNWMITQFSLLFCSSLHLLALFFKDISFPNTPPHPSVKAVCERMHM